MNYFHLLKSNAIERNVSWQRAIILLMMLAVLNLPISTAVAAANTPDPLVQEKPSVAVQLYTTGIQIAPLLPKILGFSAPQTYLLLLQNNQELRATGGFITAVGRITLDQGRVTDLVMNDSYDIVRHDVDHPLAPDPLKRFMNIELLFLRDVNWSPDLPTTARLASSLYKQDAGIAVDGVITVDLQAAQLLVAALAPLQLPGTDVTLTADNVMTELVHMWDRPPTSDVAENTASDSLLDRKDWLIQRKDFIPLVADAVISRIKSGNFNPLSLLDSVMAALNQRSVQVWLADPTAADLLAQQGWDGGLHPTENADFVALVDTNMGYNKVDAVLERSLQHTVTWPHGPTAPAQASVAVTYHHPLNVVDESCTPGMNYSQLDSYDEMIERCYFDYARLYVPAGSELIALEGVQADSVVAQAGERNTEVFAGYFSMQPGETHTITFTYTLPPTITPQGYQLVVQRQSGARPLPLLVTVNDTVIDVTLNNGRLSWPPTEPTVAVKQ